MAIEKFPNNYATQLNGAINDSTTSVVVDAVPADVATGNFRIKIDGEWMKVTAITSLTLTVVRGIEGSTAVSHGDNTPVYGVFTGGAAEQLRADGITSGALADAPANSPGGRLYFPSDAPMVSLSDGSAKTTHGPIFKLTASVDGDFAWINQGGASVSTTNGGIFLTAPATSSPPKLRIRKKTAPSTPYTLTVRLATEIYPSGVDQLAGIGFRESATGKLETLHFVFSTTFILVASKWSSATAYVGDRASVDVFKSGGINWLRLVFDGTTLSFQYSTTGYFWRTLASAAKADYFTTAPDEIFFFAAAAAATYDVGAHLLSWKQE